MPRTNRRASGKFKRLRWSRNDQGDAKGIVIEQNMQTDDERRLGDGADRK
jgi:hypothetical protein